MTEPGAPPPEDPTRIDAVAPLREHPEVIGPCKILDVLGEGGMGTVYLAQQREPVRRRVALKLVKPGMGSKEVLARFDLERQALAVMNHDAIAKVFDAGTTELGQPYFVMEFVEGRPITEYCDKHRLSIQERIDLFIKVCHGVTHAHQKGVIHRDLKPNNILVARSGDQHLPKIIDFGIARATDQQLVEHTIFTEQGRLVGTPEYMSPEQAGGDSSEIDTRTDIYSLGVILYQMLTGELPFDTQELRKAGMLEIQRKLQEDEPRRPSTRITTTKETAETNANRRRTTYVNLCKALKGDLDWIVMMAMAKEPERRYETANGLASDLQRHLQFEPVLAGPPGLAYRARKVLRRYRAQVVSAAALLLVLVGGIVASTKFAIDANAGWKQAEENAAGMRNALAARDEALSEFNLLSAVVHLENARNSEAALYPAWPEQVEALEAWLAQDAKRVLDVTPDLARTLARLESEAETLDDGSLRFADESLQFLFATLSDVQEQITDFERKLHAGVTRRLAWARDVEERTITRYADAWADAAARLRQRPEFADFNLRPQIGLVPLGPDPESGLEEFYHPATAVPGTAIPFRPKPDRPITMTEEMGMVFALLPGDAAFEIGSYEENPQEVAIRPNSPRRDAPHLVDLGPFLISKFEVTQAQWARQHDGHNPSSYFAKSNVALVNLEWTNPVEDISWGEALRCAERLGLELPTEAQWEYACRAGTDTRWFTGDEEESLQDYANIADQHAKRSRAPFGRFANIDDGHGVHAPVGSFLPNPFGIHDTHGNVWEWTRDTFANYGYPVRSGDGLRLVDEDEIPEEERGRRVMRGGSFSDLPMATRSTYRTRGTLRLRNSGIGARFSRALR